MIADRRIIVENIFNDYYSGWVVKSDPNAVQKVVTLIDQKLAHVQKCPKMSFSLHCYILSLFLPLDIDMQALEIIKNDLEKVNKYLWGDKDKNIEGMFESHKSGEHYRQKLYDFWHLLGKKEYLEEIRESASSKVKSLTPIDNPSTSIQQLAGLNNRDPKETLIYKFLESLDTAKKDSTNITAKDLCEPFKNLKVNDKEMKSVPKWYRALAEELRKLSA